MPTFYYVEKIGIIFSSSLCNFCVRFHDRFVLWNVLGFFKIVLLFMHIIK